MRTISTVVAVIAATLIAVAPMSAQETQRADSLENEIRLLKARLDSLQLVLERLVREGRDPRPVEDELAALRAAAQDAAAQEGGRADTAGQGQSRTRNLQALNPEISVTGDIVGNFVAPADEDAYVSATPREFEFSFQAALDPYTRTKVFITREEAFEVAGLAEEGGEEEGHGFEIEEGYMYWVGLPGGFGAKLGKFRQEIGLYNRWHTHALLDVERPLAAMTFLGEDGLIQTGASITFPSFTYGPASQTVTFEATRANNETLFAGGNEIGFLGRVQSFIDLGASAYLQLGATGVYGENDGESLTSKLLALDVSFRWTPPGRALYQGLQLKSEWYFAAREVGPVEVTGNGGYVQANYRLNRWWILGARADYVSPVGNAPNLVQFAPSISWWQSEWVRLRLQYNYFEPDGGSGNHTLLFQAVWAIGPHKHETY
jgi:hypothetical protein